MIDGYEQMSLTYCIGIPLVSLDYSQLDRRLKPSVHGCTLGLQIWMPSMKSIKSSYPEVSLALSGTSRTVRQTALLNMLSSCLSYYRVMTIWNIDNCEQDYEPATKWEDKLKEITWSLDDSDSRFRHARWHEVFDDQLKSTPMTIQSADPLFSLPLGEDVVKWTNWLSKDAVWDRFHTISHTAVLKGQQLEVWH